MLLLRSNASLSRKILIWPMFDKFQCNQPGVSQCDSPPRVLFTTTHFFCCHRKTLLCFKGGGCVFEIKKLKSPLALHWFSVSRYAARVDALVWNQQEVKRCKMHIAKWPPPPPPSTPRGARLNRWGVNGHFRWAILVSRCELCPVEWWVSAASFRLVCKATHANVAVVVLITVHAAERKQASKTGCFFFSFFFWEAAVSHMSERRGEPAASTRGRSRIKVFFLGTLTLREKSTENSHLALINPTQKPGLISK